MTEQDAREQRRKRMRDGVERKNEEARVAAEERSLQSSERPQEAIAPRQKSSGHKKKTADKWNQ
jgi:hypothetical protein